MSGKQTGAKNQRQRDSETARQRDSITFRLVSAKSTGYLFAKQALSKTLTFNLPLKRRTPRRPGKRNDIPNIAHAGDEQDDALEAEAEARVGAAAEFAEL